MAEIIDNLNQRFIATVYGYNIQTRELDVFIPKLMPQIPEGQKERKSITNLGNITANIGFNHDIKISSTIKVKAEDKDEALPKIGSKVLVLFYDNRFKYGFWRKFNPNADYNVIDEEKYPRQNYFQINDKKTTVNKDDIIILKLDGYDITLQENEKQKIFSIISETLEKRLLKLEESLGMPAEIDLDSDLFKVKNENSEIENILNVSEPTGVYKEIQSLNNSLLEKIEEQQKTIDSLTKRIEKLENQS